MENRDSTPNQSILYREIHHSSDVCVGGIPLPSDLLPTALLFKNNQLNIS